MAAATPESPAPVSCIAQAGGGAKAGGALEFESGEKGLEISDLIEQAKSITGEEFFFDPRELSETRVSFTGKMSVPREKFLSFLDWCLHETGFVETERMVAGARVHSITKLGGQGGGGGRSNQALKSNARVVERAELDALADRFTLVTTTYTCKSLPAREAVTTLQLYFADAWTEAIRNIEGTEAVVMTGLAPNVAALCAMLDRLDAQVVKSEGFARPLDLARKVSELEKQVAGLLQRAKEEDRAQDPNKK
jgi:type II secretory pathway component GspD/PulD (secretin)